MRKIFILHGWTYSKDKWTALSQEFQAAGFIVDILSVPGLTEPTDKVWSLDDYVEWLKEKITEEPQPILIAHSNGGRIALAFSAKYPTRLKQLILIDSAGIFHDELPIRLKRALFGSMAKLGKKITSSETMRKILYKLAGESDYKNATPQMRKTMANLISMDLTGRLDQIQTPTLLIWGEHDKATPLSDGQLMNKLITGSKLVVIVQAGHSPHFTHAKQISTRILEELK